MARNETSTLDGLEVGYGTRTSLNEESGEIHTLGNTKQLELHVDFSQIPDLAVGQARSKKVGAIPSGAVVRSAELIVITTFAGLTVTTGRLAVGTVDAAGAQVTAAGLIADQIEADLAAGDSIEGAGADVNGTAVAADTFVSIEMTGADPTAGEGVIVVTYDMPVPSSQSPAIIIGTV